MKTRKWSDVKKKRFSREKRKELDGKIRQELFEMDLRALREILGVTQEQLAASAGMTQSEISRLERRSDHKFSTLKRIVESLGGKLEVVATFGDRSVRLHSSE
jgi:DNA-binding Xre family transcriptional regulator